MYVLYDDHPHSYTHTYDDTNPHTHTLTHPPTDNDVCWSPWQWQWQWLPFSERTLTQREKERAELAEALLVSVREQLADAVKERDNQMNALAKVSKDTLTYFIIYSLNYLLTYLHSHLLSYFLTHLPTYLPCSLAPVTITINNNNKSMYLLH